MITTPNQLFGLLMKDRRVNPLFPRKYLLIYSEHDDSKTNTPQDKPVFGQYACAGPSGAVLRVGDEVEVTERLSKSPTPILPGTPVTASSPAPFLSVGPPMSPAPPLTSPLSAGPPMSPAPEVPQIR